MDGGVSRTVSEEGSHTSMDGGRPEVQRQLWSRYRSVSRHTTDSAQKQAPKKGSVGRKFANIATSLSGGAKELMRKKKPEKSRQNEDVAAQV
jgi:hypothetical protein